MAKESEKIFECEAKKLFMRNGEKRREWVKMSVADAVRDEVKEYRCKDCHGAVKLFRRLIPNPPVPHILHKLQSDSDYCPGGLNFRLNPGREPRTSLAPVK